MVSLVEPHIAITNDICWRHTVVDLAFSTSAYHLCCPVVAVPSMVAGVLHNVPFPIVVGCSNNAGLALVPAYQVVLENSR